MMGMATNSYINAMSNRFRMTGTSGLDVESMVQQLMKVERLKMDKLVKSRQLKTWMMEDYRSITNKMREFYDTYFNIAKPATNFTSASAFTAYKAVSSNSAISVTAGSGATTGVRQITVKSTASAATKNGASMPASLKGASAVDMTKMKKGKQFTITLDGVTKTITLDKDYSSGTVSELAGDGTSGLQKLIDDAFGAGKIKVEEDKNNPGALVFTPALKSSSLSIGNATDSYLSVLGLVNGKSNAITSGAITDFSGTEFKDREFKVQIGSGTAVTVKINAEVNSIDELINSINDALIGTEVKVDGKTSNLGKYVRVIKDSGSSESDKLKFVAIDSSQTIKLQSSDNSDADLLSKIGISSGTSISNLSGSVNISASDAYKSFNIKVDDGTTVKTVNIYLDGDYTDFSDLQAAIQSQISDKVSGVSGVEVRITDGKISFVSTDQNAVKQITVEAEDVRSALGFSSSQTSSNRINLNDTLENINKSGILAENFNFGTDDELSFTINGEEFTVSKTDTLSSIISRINSSSAGVTIRYDTVNNRFAIQSKNTGSAAVIDNEDNTDGDGGNFFKALGITTTTDQGGSITRGTNASLTIDGVDVERSTNEFTIEGVTYKLQEMASGADPISATVTVSSNPDELFEKIKGFVDKYNELVGLINTKLNEERFRDYEPLTSEQKAQMSENEIKLWEEKARSGLLRNDSTLSSILNNMRRALYDAIYSDASDSDSKLSLHLSSIGITTSSNYKDGGKLVIDEQKLKNAIINNPDEVVQLFAKDDSGISYYNTLSDSSKKSERYKESGLAVRLSDIIQDNIRVIGNSNGQKGALLEKAGMIGDSSEYTNLLYKEIKSYDKSIYEMTIKLIEKENSYYNMFAAMEDALNKMYSQSSWLAAQFSQG
ncbi:hypothetical protein CDQ84_03655 [Clostridium thermosuccinogenes]|uniref:Flagellar hook-associated protein 2 n=2 Tax=Clostridium thermosuccinogenes TaxID=84032 RepID=A0A2K2FK83_9CLOT|nr:hypothetical protein CDO33_00725 [Pseudoclostridium thermosuccinogenes]PNT99179.1 hypothetical protein CDQ85_03655 [Pseudoclostridium thermosuccinogenes]PNU00982.1 hypothetical protein CDQ84_03655 [Pseudoclostridium thermosuccinogenes]